MWVATQFQLRVTLTPALRHDRDEGKYYLIWKEDGPGERRHNGRFIAIMDEHLPQWRVYRQQLNSSPLAHDTWSC
jgi:hypothetical protein